jgi:hypothetical protein
MKNTIEMLTIAAAALMVVAPAYASVRLPEPVSMSLMVGGVVAIAAVRRLRRK